MPEGWAEGGSIESCEMTQIGNQRRVLELRRCAAAVLRRRSAGAALRPRFETSVSLRKRPPPLKIHLHTA